MLIERRADLSEKYKQRVSNFIKDMTEAPVYQSDHWAPSKTKLNDLVQQKGTRDHMVFSAPRTDDDIKD